MPWHRLSRFLPYVSTNFRTVPERTFRPHLIPSRHFRYTAPRFAKGIHTRMNTQTTPWINCYLVQDKSSHEGSGGGFTVVRFFHLVVENRSPAFLRKVSARYRLMKGDECFQEDDLFAENIASGATVRSSTFIRDSTVFDRIEWVGDISVQADQEVPLSWITFKPTATRASNPGCLIIVLLALFAILAYILLRG